MAGLSIQEMRLSPLAEKAALFVVKIHPEAQFTSGRRDLHDQARAMARNAILYGSAWLDTYKNKRIVKCLMTHMEENPGQCSLANTDLLAGSFHALLTEHFMDDLNKFPHVRGDAFDLQYPRLKSGLHDKPSADHIMATIRSLPEFGIPLEWVTDQEGKLKVIHVQVPKSETVKV